MMDGMIMLALCLLGIVITYYGKEIAMEDTFISWEQIVDPTGSNTGRQTFEPFTESKGLLSVG